MEMTLWTWILTEVLLSNTQMGLAKLKDNLQSMSFILPMETNKLPKERWEISITWELKRPKCTQAGVSTLSRLLSRVASAQLRWTPLVVEASITLCNLMALESHKRSRVMALESKITWHRELKSSQRRVKYIKILGRCLEIKPSETWWQGPSKLTPTTIHTIRHLIVQPKYLPSQEVHQLKMECLQVTNGLACKTLTMTSTWWGLIEHKFWQLNKKIKI